MKTKIAIPTRGNLVDSHFGHCEYYTVFTIDESKNVVLEEIIPSPEGCGCKSNIASILREHGVEIMLAGSMGDGAVYVLESNGIEVVRGCSGDKKEVLDSFLSGKISDSGQGCTAHEEGHECGYNH